MRWAAATLALPSMAVDAAAYLPGVPEPDPPTGESRGNGSTPAAEPLASGNGFRFVLGPVRYSGSVGVDGRWLRLDDGTTAAQAQVFNEIDFATYVWQPWFIQLGAGFGVLLSRDRTHAADATDATSAGTALTGRFSTLVFPASRFPFEMRAEVADSRTSGDVVGTDYRSHRFSLTQSYRPLAGNDQYNVHYDYSRLSASNGQEDTVRSLYGTAQRQFEHHSLEFNASASINDNDRTGDSSRYTTLMARHGFRPSGSLHVDTVASWDELRLRSAAAPSATSGSDIRQITSFATWNAQSGQWLYSETSPWYLTGSARFSDAGVEFGAQSQRTRTLNAALGVTQDLTRRLRWSGSVSATLVDPDVGNETKAATANVAVTYTPDSLRLDGWTYSSSIGGNASATRATGSELRDGVGAQFNHGVFRSIAVNDTSSISFGLNQALAALRESTSNAIARSLTHSASVFWQGGNGGASQSLAGLSVSDSRTYTDVASSFQLINAQVSRRTQLSRTTSWSGNLTLQASRNDLPTIDPLTGARVGQSAGWQSFYGGSLSYQDQRLFGVPRLRFTALLSVDSQQLERRQLGDIDAPRERISHSLEGRLEYAIGRLEARLTARTAQVDGRTVTSIFGRVQRRY